MFCLLARIVILEERWHPFRRKFLRTAPNLNFESARMRWANDGLMNILQRDLSRGAGKSQLARGCFDERGRVQPLGEEPRGDGGIARNGPARVVRGINGDDRARIINAGSEMIVGAARAERRAGENRAQHRAFAENPSETSGTVRSACGKHGKNARVYKAMAVPKRPCIHKICFVIRPIGPNPVSLVPSVPLIRW